MTAGAYSVSLTEISCICAGWIVVEIGLLGAMTSNYHQIGAHIIIVSNDDGPSLASVSTQKY